MIKMIELRKALETILKTSASNVYYQKAPKTAVMPYVVFDYPNSVDFGTLENFVLDIDVWDDAVDTTALETLIDSIDISLHKIQIMVTDKVAIIPYRENRMAPIDDDERINRRKYVYQVRTYLKTY